MSPRSSDDVQHVGRTRLTELILEVFRTNGTLLSAGDDLVRDLGLTSARWQVLGAIALSPESLPVAHLARNMGLTRQAVQRVVDDMRRKGLVRTEDNPHHRRASLVTMTAVGGEAYRQAIIRQERWADALVSKLDRDAVSAAATLLQDLRTLLGDAKVVARIDQSRT